MKITLGSLFDGAGTIPFAAQLCGATPVWSSEIEKFPCEVTAKRFPNMKQLGDITKINGREIEPVDIIAGGSPCQDLSVAGQRAGLGGERSGLFMEQIRVIKEMRDETSKRANEPVRPRYAVWENVPGAFSSNKGEDFRVVLEEFCKVKDERANVPRPLGGGGGNLAGVSWETGIPWLGASSMLNFGECPNVVEESGLWQILEANVPQKYFLSETACLGVLRRAERRGKELPTILKTALEQQIERWGKYGTPLPWNTTTREGVYPSCGRTLTARGDGSPCIDRGQEVIVEKCGAFLPLAGDKAGSVAYTGNGCPTLRAESPTACVICFSQDAYDKYEETEHGATLRASGGIYGGGSENLVCKPVYCLQGNGIDRADTAGCNGKGVTENVSYTLNTVDRHAVCCEAECHTHDFLVRMREGKDGGGKGALVQEDKSGTIACNNDQVLFQRAETQYIVRRLTPLECCRLQGMPDFWTDGVEGSDAARYKLWGNGMALPNALYIMEGLVENDER